MTSIVAHEALHTWVGYLFVLLCILFGVAFIAESVAYHYLIGLYIPSLNLYVRTASTIVAAGGLLAFAVTSAKMPRRLIHFAVFWLTLITLGGLLGWSHADDLWAFGSHLQYYCSFLIILLACSLATQLNADKLLTAIARFAYLVIIIMIIALWRIYAVNPSNVSLSLNFTIVIFVLSYFLSLNRKLPRRAVWGQVIAVIIAFLTMKRALWVTVVAGIALGNRGRMLKLAATAVVLVAMGTGLLIADGEESGYVGYVTEHLNSRFVIDQEKTMNTLDAISSGRISNMVAVLDELRSRKMLLIGLGFGVTLDLSAASGAQTWETSGVDVILLHFWMLHGVLVGTALLVILTWFLYEAYRLHRRADDQWLSMWFYILALSFVNAWFTFVPWDPIWPVSIGLLMARKRQLARAPARSSDNTVKIVTFDRVAIASSDAAPCKHSLPKG